MNPALRALLPAGARLLSPLVSRAMNLLALAAVLVPLAAQTALPTYKELKYPPLKPIKIPDVATYTLPNGLRLYLLENHELPLIRGLALVRTGNLFDPADKVGLATVTGVVLRSGGTKNKTGDQLDEQLENIAASVESSISETNGQVSFSTLKDHTDEVLGVVRDILTNPEFRQDKLDLIKSQLQSNISRRNDDAQGIAQREFADLLYGKDTPYGWQMEYATVNAIQRQDLIAFYQRYYFPKNIMFAVQGDFQTAEMKAKLEKLFAGWTADQLPVPAFPTVKPGAKPGIYLATKTNVTQTNFILGQIGGVLKDKDYPALEVMADILGGGFRSRLFQRVRTQLGYAYNVSADWGAGYDHPGLLEISASTKSLSTTDAIKVIQEEVARIRNAEVGADELETARQSVLNSFVFNFDTPSKTLNRLLVYEYYGYPKDFLTQYQKALEKLTRADILRVAREHIDPKNFVTVAVGNSKDFGSPLTAIGPVTPLDITIPGPASAAAPPASSAGIEKGKQLLQRVQQASGGTEKLESVKDVRATADIQMDTGSGAMKATQTVQWLAPSTFRQDSVLPFGKIAAYSDGKTGWIVTPQGGGPLPEPQLRQIQEEMFRFYTSLLLSDHDASRTISQGADGMLDVSDKSGHSVKLAIDPKTGLPSKEIYNSPQPQGASTPVEETFSDFRDVQGIKVPMKITVVQNGRRFADITVKEFKINTGAKADDLARKP